MAFYNVEKRQKADGTIRWRCVVGVKEKGKYTHRESKTFSKASIAKAWGARRVLEIESGIAAPTEQKPDVITLSELIDKYLNHPTVKAGRSARANLNMIKRHELATCDVLTVTAKDFIEFGRVRREQGRAPATVANNLSNIAAVFHSAPLLFNITVNMSALDESKKYMIHAGITGPANKRNRRPTKDEVEIILAELRDREKRASSGAPFSQMFMFAILTCMRVGEVCKVLWQDVDYKNKAILVRDRKDPRKKEGNHMVVPLLGTAWDILEAQPKTADRIFPYNSPNISQVFSAVKSKFGIVDLRYHDMRREGASRLFEMGFSVEEVAQVTGHKNLQTLWTVYREIYPQTLHDRFAELQRQRESAIDNND
ncbi:tyrosine-type recombinase/integrase [Citrobacter sp. OP27]